MKDFLYKHRKAIICIAIPIFSVILSLVFKLAQGERLEEVLGGLIIGILCDTVYLIIGAVFAKHSDNMSASQEEQ